MTDGGPATPGMAPPPHRSMRWWLLLLFAASVPVIGEVLGHGYFSKIGNVFAHHGFHLATVIVAGGIFWFVVAGDIKRNGVPPRLQALARLYHSLRGRAASLRARA